MERIIIKVIQKAIMLFVVFNCAFAQTQFQKVFDYAEEGLSLTSQGIVAIETFDGGYMIASKRQVNNNTTAEDVYLIKTNNMGNPLWSKVYGTFAAESAASVEQTDDNGDKVRDDGYIIVGSTQPVVHLHTVIFGMTLRAKRQPLPQGFHQEPISLL